MKRYFLVLVLCAYGAAAQAAEVNCYNDDSHDIINQDRLTVPIFGGWAPIPVPADCGLSPATSIDERGRVFVDGQEAYSEWMDAAVEARVAPTGAVSILTERGSLYLYQAGVSRSFRPVDTIKRRTGLTKWFDAGISKVREFRMARDGSLIAATDDGQLVLGGRKKSLLDKVTRLYAGLSGRVVALMSNGSVLDESGELFRGWIDGAASVKLAADGTVVWLTREGRVGSTRNARIYDGRIDPAISFKVNPAGRVAYLNRDGELGRDGTKLSSGFTRIVDYLIRHNGSVAATDDQRRSYFFK